MGTMELMFTNNGEEVSPGFDIRTLGPVVHAAQMQYQRQMKNLQAIQKQFELLADSNTAWRERERRREEKYSQIEQDRQTQRDNLLEYSHRMAEKRAERLEAAYRHEETLRAAAQAKVQAVEDRLARFAEEQADHAVSERQRIAALDAKRDATYRLNLELLEERRQAILAHERKIEDMLRQREELRQLQAQIKAEEDFLREQQRRAIKARAEDGLAGRVAHFQAKKTAKDEQLARRKKEIAQQRRMRAEELRERFEYIAAQAHEAAELAEAERQMLAGKIEDKVARAEALAAHRAALLEEMQILRHQMQLQEEYLRSSLLRMQQLGTVTVPQAVVRSLEGAQLAGPLMTAVVLRGTQVVPSHLMLEGAPSSSEGGTGRGQGQGAGTGASLPAAAAERSFAKAGSAVSALNAAALSTPRSMRSRLSSMRRPKSAGATPRGTRGLSPAAVSSRSVGGRSGHVITARGYQSAVNSPRVTSAGGSRGSRRVFTVRPASTGGVLYRKTAMPASSPVSPTGPSSSTGHVPGVPNTAPGGRHRSSLHRQPTLDKEVDATYDISPPAAEIMTAAAAASGLDSGAHELVRPGSRREEELRVVLQEEIAKESERQALLSMVTDDDERGRLVRFFTREREEARRRILALSSAAQAALYQ